MAIQKTKPLQQIFWKFSKIQPNLGSRPFLLSSLTCTHDHVGGDIDGIPEGEDLEILNESGVALSSKAAYVGFRSIRHSQIRPNIKTNTLQILKNCTYISFKTALNDTMNGQFMEKLDHSKRTRLDKKIFTWNQA